MPTLSRLAKLASGIAVVVFLGWLVMCNRAEAAETDIDVALVFLTDVSGSMTPGEVVLVRDAHAVAMVSEEVLTAIGDSATGRIAVAYVEFGSFARPVIGWTEIGSTADAAGFAGAIDALPIDRMSNITEATRIGAGLNLARQAFDELPFRALRLVVDVVGDGVAEDPAVVIAATADLASRGVVVNAIPLMIDGMATVRQYYEANVRTGPGSFVTEVTAIADLPQALRRKIVLELY